MCTYYYVPNVKVYHSYILYNYTHYVLFIVYDYTIKVYDTHDGRRVN